MTDHYNAAATHLAAYEASRSPLTPPTPTELLQIAGIESNLAIAEALHVTLDGLTVTTTVLKALGLHPLAYDDDLNQTATADYTDDPEALREP